MLPIIYGLASALSWGAGDFIGGLAARKVGAYRSVFYAEVIGILFLFIVISFSSKSFDYKDAESLKRESEFGARLGFSGKQIIHPNQVSVVQTASAPSAEAIAYAKRIVETFEVSQKEGRGAYSLDGKMIDMPLLKHAQKVLSRAKAAGK